MITKDESFRLSKYTWNEIGPIACEIRDSQFPETITFSPKVFFPLTQLCRDVCSYCTFAKNPTQLDKPYMSLADIEIVCEEGVKSRCSEALFTLGESPESRHEIATNWLESNNYQSTIDYLVDAARMAMNIYGMLPHVNPGAISDRDLLKLKNVSASQGMMLESIALRLCEPGGPHFGSPDKTPARRLATLEAAGRCRIPFTTGILIGIGETRLERIEALLAIRELNQRFGHIQEVIVQNFLPKVGTAMASEDACDEEEHLWSIAAARIILENTTHIQAPPNLSTSISNIVKSGIDDLGGISPVTKDYVNPEKPWPHLNLMNADLKSLSKKLTPRACIYPEFIDKPGFVEEPVLNAIKNVTNEKGYLSNIPQSLDLITEHELDDSQNKKYNSNLPVSLLAKKRN